MYGIFMESWVIFKNYGGTSFYLILYLAALIGLLVFEKDKRIRILLGYLPLTFLVLFFIPVFRIGYVAALDDSDTYYRLLWLIPMSATVCYMACRLIERKRRVGLLAMTIVLIACGSYAYKNVYVSKAENIYHLPDTAVEICKKIAPGDGERVVYALFPKELVYYVRQYDTDIYLLYGRDYVEPTWGYHNPFYDAMESGEVIDLEKLLELSRTNDDHQASYIVMGENHVTDVDPEEAGLTLVDTIDGYRIYFDPVADASMEALIGHYYK